LAPLRWQGPTVGQAVRRTLRATVAGCWSRFRASTCHQVVTGGSAVATGLQSLAFSLTPKGYGPSEASQLPLPGVEPPKAPPSRDDWRARVKAAVERISPRPARRRRP
jgi:hypothetical protein